MREVLKRGAEVWAGRAFGTVFDREMLSGAIDELGVRSTHKIYARALWRQKILRLNYGAPAPIGLGTIVSDFNNLTFGDRAVQNLASPGCYFQNFSATTEIGRGVFIAPNVGLLTANHDPNDLASHEPGRPITVGDNSWIGMNSVILPGVVLGPRTIVGAGSVVTRSFPEGGVVLAGVPARIIRHASM